MPTLFKLFGLIFRIYTRDHRPPHVHVISQEGEAIFTVSEDRVEMRENKGMRQKDISLSLSVIYENKELILKEWENYHN